MTNLKAALAELAHEALSDAESLGHPLCGAMQRQAARESKAELLAAIAALQEAEPAAAEGQAGWRWVPIEPTREMVRACMHNDNGGLVTPEYRKAIYRAMLAAVDVQEPT
jgi:hypothetical protein